MIQLDAARTTRWSAASAETTDDGTAVWLFQRWEDAGTSWSIKHTPTGLTLDGFASLRVCRAMASDPADLLARMREQQARRDAVLAGRAA